MKKKISELMKELAELKEENKKLRAQASIETKSASIIAHDLRHPFIALLGLSSLLESDYEKLPVETHKKFISEIYKQAGETLMLLENLLDWSKLRLEKRAGSPTSISLKEVNNKVVGFLQRRADEKRITLIDAVPDEIIVLADSIGLQTIIRNLISNAIKFTDCQGKITISAAVSDNTVRISVTDTGIGIKPENLEKLFNPEFYTTKGTNNEKGTGLGLRLCKGLVEEQGGKIFVESVPGEGTTFTFTTKSAK